MTGLPYPPVFHDWQHPEDRVATSSDPAGVGVELLIGPGVWQRVVLTEDDACLMAASLLLRAGRKKLCERVVRAVHKARSEASNPAPGSVSATREGSQRGRSGV